MTRNPLLIIGIIGTLVATAATVMYSRAPQTPPDPAKTTVQVMAAADLKHGTRLTSSHLAGSAMGGGLTTDEQNVAAGLLGNVLKREVAKGTVITPEDVQVIDTSAVPDRIPVGLRGLPVHLKDTPASDQELFRSGDFVDVLQVSANEMSRTIAERVLVLQGLEPRPVPSAEAEPAAEAPGGTLVLGVTPAEAIRIADAEKSGQLRLLLRSRKDDSVTGAAATSRPAVTEKPPPRGAPPLKPAELSPPSGSAHRRRPPPETEVDIYVIKGASMEIQVVPK